MISILCPTRARPFELARMVSSAITMASSPTSIEFLFRMDNDDPTGEQSAAAVFADHQFKSRAFTLNGPRHRNMCLYWNELLPHAHGDVLMLANDDIIFRSAQWNVQVERAFDQWPDRIGLVGGDDGASHGAAIPHPFVTRAWTDTLGYFAAPYFESDYGGDTWNEDVARRIGRRCYLPELLIEHMHFIFGKAQRDRTTLDRLERHAQQNPGALYAQLLPKRMEDARKLTQAILDYEAAHAPATVPIPTGDSTR